MRSPARMTSAQVGRPCRTRMLRIHSVPMTGDKRHRLFTRDAAARSLVMRAPTPIRCRGGALAVDRDGFSAAVTAALEAHPLSNQPRRNRGLPPDDWDSVIVPPAAHLAALGDDDPRLTGETRSPFSMHRAIVHRSPSTCRMLFQSRYDKPPRRSGAIHQLPLSRQQYERSWTAYSGEKDRFHAWKRHALFRRSCRSSDAEPTRERCVTVRLNRSGSQSAQSAAQALRGGAIAPGNRLGPCSTCRLPDQAQAGNS